MELFGGEIAPFLAGDEIVFGNVRELLDEQFARLSATEQTVLLWLAILREPVSIEELLTVLATVLSRAQVLEAVEALRRRSLIERGKRLGSFTLQSVVLEYVDGRLIDEAVHEIEERPVGTLDRAQAGTGQREGICAANAAAPHCGPSAGTLAAGVPGERGSGAALALAASGPGRPR